jgi:hypothetical protein
LKITNTSITKKRAGGMAQGVGPKYKPQYRQKKKKRNITSTSNVPILVTAHLNSSRVTTVPTSKTEN